MHTKIWRKSCRSVCSISFLSTSNVKVRGISGFMFGNQIITDDMIYNVKDADRIEISFYKEDGISAFATLKMGYSDLLKILPGKNEFDNLGIAVIPAKFNEFENVPQLSLCKSCAIEIGRSVAVIGYQLEHNNMALKTGIISSNYTNIKGLSFIQYDSTVIAGYSGSPLLDSASGNVLGIVMNKETGFVKSYRELMDIIDLNLKTLKDQEGKYDLLDVDLVQVLSANQNQIKHIVREFFLNATVKVGFALEIGHLVEYMETKLEMDIDPVNFCD